MTAGLASFLQLSVCSPIKGEQGKHYVTLQSHEEGTNDIEIPSAVQRARSVVGAHSPPCSSRTFCLDSQLLLYLPPDAALVPTERAGKRQTDPHRHTVGKGSSAEQALGACPPS